MLLIDCPHCGPRNRNEFYFGGDASLARPESTSFDDSWLNFIYLRDNIRGMHRELWQHRSGCRMWLIVERDTFTHEIRSVQSAQALKRTDTAQDPGAQKVAV